MPTVPPDYPTPRPLAFALPLPDGRWALCPGTALVLDGLLRALNIPGLGHWTGPAGGGLTAVVHVVYRVRGRRGARTGTVTRWEVEDGVVTSTREVAPGAELVDVTPPDGEPASPAAASP